MLDSSKKEEKKVKNTQKLKLIEIEFSSFAREIYVEITQFCSSRETPPATAKVEVGKKHFSFFSHESSKLFTLNNAIFLLRRLQSFVLSRLEPSSLVLNSAFNAVCETYESI